ncbi:type I secretion system permease/ATPase [Candidatus Nitrospira inopinata]|jgi:subfamily B ATP-binding cassette protein HlyB/CyaB|uniref:Toxin RTX-I translocation ATP-binding protein n=1 Tax=Candidatus Nitrospira inopinata TaxID=1715989 RepID=A0A0S4L2A8_9BACT|nr:type I secretion system permease/ATPase [Candidatus Nitrospira inopinata]CUQ68178.1 Toxin RTX-I translocation ATP-binding protein [Candidatus Nitrospira inopinata]
MPDDANAASPSDSSQPSSAVADTGLLCLLILARFYDLPADASQLRHQFARLNEPLSPTDLVRAAKHLGLKAGRITVRWDKLPTLPLPAMVRRADGRYLVLAKADEQKVLVQDPVEARPLVLSRDRFEALWSGEVLLFTKRAHLRPQDLKFDFAWFIPAIVKYRKLLGEVLVASFVLQLFGLLTPLFTQVVIDKVLVHRGFTTLHVLAIGMVALVIFEAVLGGLRTYLFAHTTNRIDVGLGAQLFRHILALPLAYFEARRVGDTVARVRELEHIRQFLTSNSVTVVLDLFFMAVFLAVMWLYSPMLTLVVAASLPFYAGLSLVITPAIRARLHEKFNRGAENQAFLVETVTGIQTVKAMAVEPPLQRRWDEQLAGYVRASFRATNLITIAGQAATAVQKLTTVAILWVGAYRVIGGELSIGQLIAFNMLAAQVTGPLLRLVNLWQEFQQVGISVQRLGDVLNAQPEPSYNPNRTTLPRVAGRVSFEDVTFRYRPDGPEVLRKVSFVVEPGQVVGLVGRSGSGKSTIAKLIQRLYVPERGRVLVDGVDLAQVDPAWLRRHVGVVLQENFLFNRSVRDNIALTDPGSSMERVIQAAKLAGAHEFILELPEGYDTVIGEQGCSLSGGQRQRIAIARALIADPRILIFDEATSALDYESEAVIQRNTALIAKGRTVIIIAHRLSTVRPAHRIYVVERGEIIEQGSHDELLRAGGLYARLHAYQTRVAGGYGG